MRYPKNTLDFIIVAFLWAEWFVKKCLWYFYCIFEKYDYWIHNSAVRKAAEKAEKNPPIFPDDNT